MLGYGVVTGKSVMLGGDKGGPVVFSAVDQFGGKPGGDLPVGKLDRLGAERAHHLRHQFGLLHAQPQTLEVGQRADRSHAVVDRACSRIVKGEADEPVWFEAAENFVADRAIEYFLQMLGRAEQE